jgi:F-type H+-transporting ATP synthase subunit e
LRWSALGLGIFYGFTHQRAITASQKAEHAQHEYEKKEKLIQQAKAEFAKKKNPTSGDSGTSNPMLPQSIPGNWLRHIAHTDAQSGDKPTNCACSHHRSLRPQV